MTFCSVINGVLPIYIMKQLYNFEGDATPLASCVNYFIKRYLDAAWYTVKRTDVGWSY